MSPRSFLRCVAHPRWRGLGPGATERIQPPRHQVTKRPRSQQSTLVTRKWDIRQGRQDRQETEPEPGPEESDHGRIGELSDSAWRSGSRELRAGSSRFCRDSGPDNCPQNHLPCCPARHPASCPAGPPANCAASHLESDTAGSGGNRGRGGTVSRVPSRRPRGPASRRACCPAHPRQNRPRSLFPDDFGNHLPNRSPCDPHRDPRSDLNLF